MSNGNGNGGKKAVVVRWGSDPIEPELLDPSGEASSKPMLPGYGGFPYRGPVPNLRHDDIDRRQPEVQTKVHIDILDLAKKPDMQRYRALCQMVANGFAQISKEDVRYDEKKKSWRVFIRWLELYTTLPKGNVYGNPGRVG
jgi:hypothetical protein